GFGERPFDMGKHVAVIGAGDVMVDIAHWLTRYKKVERVTAIVRRGPVERKISDTKMGFKFLASPKRILVDDHNRVRGLEMEDNKLDPKGEDTVAVGLKQYYEFPCDAVIFAVGDKVDETVGLPYKGGLFITNPNKTGNDPDDSLFQAYDEVSGKIMDG